MSEENVETARRGYEIFNAACRDREFREGEALEFFAPDVHFDLSRNVFNPSVQRGMEGFRQVFEGIWEVWEEFEMRPRESFDAGDKVVAVLDLHGRAREGLDVTREIAVLMTFRDGKIVDYVGGMDRGEALEAAGLRE